MADFKHVEIIAPTSLVTTLMVLFGLIRVFMCYKRISTWRQLFEYLKAQKNDIYYIYVYISSNRSDQSEYADKPETPVSNWRQGAAMGVTILVGIGITAGLNVGIIRFISKALDEPSSFDDYIFDNSSIFTYNKSLLILDDSKPRIASKSNIINMEESTDILDGCSLLWENEVYIFGGANSPSSVIKLIDCKMKQIRMLDFEFDSPGCLAHDFIYLCFDKNKSKLCRYSVDPWDTFDQYSDNSVLYGVPESKFNHVGIKITASSQFLIAVGSTQPINGNTELFDFVTKQWKVVDPYPYNGIVQTAPVVFYKTNFYVFAGDTTKKSIVQFTQDTFEWKLVGKLNYPRSTQSFRRFEKYIFIFGGGNTPIATEKCLLSTNSEIQCADQTPVLFNSNILVIEDSLCSNKVN